MSILFKTAIFQKISTAIDLISESTLTCKYYFFENNEDFGQNTFPDKLPGGVSADTKLISITTKGL